jgi:hypothetical protein
VRELALYFRPEELCTYETPLDAWTLAGDER